MKKSVFSKKLPAMTLQEMLIVMGIAAILMLISMPLVEPLFNKARSMEAKTQLNHVYTLEKNYYYEHSMYTTDLHDIGFLQAKLKNEDGGNSNYRIEITEASNSTFRARAIAVTDFDSDGIFNVWEIDENQKLEEVTED